LAWTIEIAATVRRDLERLDREAAKRITRFLLERVARADNPRDLGKSLTGSMKGLWSYRVGDYRILCEIEDHRFVVIAVGVGHRREIYR
jgi:mRNA interferase RelE/StbE